MSASRRTELGVKPEVHEGVVMGGGPESDRTAPSAVSPVRTPVRHELFTAKTRAAVAAVTGRDEDVGVVDEHALGSTRGVGTSTTRRRWD